MICRELLESSWLSLHLLRQNYQFWRNLKTLNESYRFLVKYQELLQWYTTTIAYIKPFMLVSIWKIIYLNCGERYEDIYDWSLHLYTQHKQLWK